MRILIIGGTGLISTAITRVLLKGVKRTVGWLDAQNAIANSDDDPLEDRVIEAWRRLSEEMVQALSSR